MKALVVTCLIGLGSLATCFSQSAHAAQAPGKPGALGTWSRPDKVAYGATWSRPLWFTIVNGALSEISYPSVDLVQTRDSFLVVKDNATNSYVDERTQCSHHTYRHAGTLAFTVESSCPGFKIVKDFIPSPTVDGLLVQYRIEFEGANERELIFVHNPTAAATPGGDGIQVIKNENGHPSLVAGQVDVRGDEPTQLHVSTIQSVSWTLSPSNATVGYEGVNGPEDQLRARGWPQLYEQARYGNVSGALMHTTRESRVEFNVTLTFSQYRLYGLLDNRQASMLKESPRQLLKQQQSEWANYLGRLDYDRNDPLAESSILIVKALEDKAYPGAILAAPGNPSIPWHVEAPEQDYENSRVRRGDSNSGYRRVWPRDLYHKAMAMLAVGDNETALNVLRWLRQVQFDNGTWSQNMWVDGKPSWQAFQIDQTGFPIALTWRLAELDLIRYSEYRAMVRRAAEALMLFGPGTGQERWEENGGLSPNSMAAAVEGLRAAAWLETLEGGDPKLSEKYMNKANEWTGQLKEWLLIPEGAFGKGYFARMELGHNGHWNPSHHSYFSIANKAPGTPHSYREDEILDGGFLQWIIAGIVNPHDEDFTRTLHIYDQNVRKETSAGLGYIRYNQDAYGANHQGGAWPLLSAERAMASIERGEHHEVEQHVNLMRGLTNAAGSLCEQDTLSVCPLGWSHAAYLILQRSIKDGRSFYVPQQAR